MKWSSLLTITSLLRVWWRWRKSLARLRDPPGSWCPWMKASPIRTSQDSIWNHSSYCTLENKHFHFHWHLSQDRTISFQWWYLILDSFQTTIMNSQHCTARGMHWRAQCVGGLAQLKTHTQRTDDSACALAPPPSLTLPDRRRRLKLEIIQHILQNMHL